MPPMNVTWLTSATAARGVGSVASMLAAFDAPADQAALALAGHWR